MDGARYLLPEDRPDYERVLEDGLGRIRHGTDLAASGLTSERLRSLALEALPLVTLRAAAEYQSYREARDLAAGRPAPTGGVPHQQGARASERPVPARPGGALPLSDERTGAGFLAVVSVLVPVLGGIAAVVFLLFGYALMLSDPEPAIAGSMRQVGWSFAVLAAVGLLVAGIELLVGAVRNGSTSVRATRPGAAGATASEAAEDAVARARHAWHRALLEEGVLPFLREAVAAGPGGPAGRDRDRVATGGSGRAVAGYPSGADHRAGGSAVSESSSETPPEASSGSEPSSGTGSSSGSASAASSGDRLAHPEYSSPGFSSGRTKDAGRAKGSSFSSPRFSSPTDRSSEDSSRSSARGFSSPAYETFGQQDASSATDSGADPGARRYSSPGYGTSGGGESGGSRPGVGGGSRGYASPGYRTPDSGGEEGGSRPEVSRGSRGYATPGGYGSPGYSPGGRGGGESGSRFGTGGFASPKRKGAPDREPEREDSADEADSSGEGGSAAR